MESRGCGAPSNGPAGQAKCEALTLLLSVITWKHHLSRTQGSLTFVGDAIGVLKDALWMRARVPILNGAFGELALQLAPWGANVRAAHIWSERNNTCDALNRLRQGPDPELALLREATRVKRKQTPRKLLDSLLNSLI